MNAVRKYWLDSLLRIVTPVLDALSRDALREEMPVEGKLPKEDRAQFTYLEALGRSLVGLAPWLACPGLTGEEEALRQKYAALARTAIAKAVDPQSPDKMNFSVGHQPIVDAAFLCQGILRAPAVLWEPLPDAVKARLLDALRATRTRKAPRNNWLLFCAMIECLLHHAGAPDWDPMRIDYALCKHGDWYKGDGWYGDGPAFHLDYYNSFVIQPMLLDVLKEIKDETLDWAKLWPDALRRASHFGALQEQLISPEGTYPLVGRSLVYRFGAFQVLGQMALLHALEEGLHPAQVRCGMTAVLKRLMAFPGTFDEKGWLTIGVCGHQPDMGEEYISTGSLYLTTAGFLPLGLPESDPFWDSPDEKWTMQALWQGENRPCQHALD